MNQIKIITPPDTIEKTTVDILAVDLNDQDQKYLIDTLLPYDIDVNIWSWNSNLNSDSEWLLTQSKLADQIIMRYNKNNAVSSWLVAKTNSFYINNGQVNILDGIAQNSVTDIKEVKLYGI